ncbi:MAG: cytochrome c [Hyphomicrobiales bacterium]|nr:cytochrome c [Hyphomicrobiales bacterium]MCP5371993.1 cytochrome c [Hyphomicrobiales bacterium]
MRYFTTRHAAMALGFAAVLAYAGAAVADGGAIKYRKAVMKAIGGHMGSMVTIVKGEGGDRADLAGHAQAMADLAKMSQHVFPKGSGTSAGETELLNAAFDKPAEFAAVQQAFVEHAAKLAEAAKGGDPKAFGAALGALGKNACKACHDNFRKKD